MHYFDPLLKNFSSGVEANLKTGPTVRITSYKLPKKASAFVRVISNLFYKSNTALHNARVCLCERRFT
ncbi:hypothetical protein ALT721_680028 [Alteromonas alvinellae]